MIDQDSIKRRERIFTQLRQSQEEANIINEEMVSLQLKMNEIRTKSYEKQTELNQLTRLVSTMIKHDCCPVEAQLRYPEELETDDMQKAENIDSMGYNYGASMSANKASSTSRYTVGR